MKISEITKFNKDMSSTLTGRHTPDTKDLLISKGYTYIDQGHYSATYLSPNQKTVLKINRDFDPGYEHFIKVIKSQPNAHFPTISDKKKLPDGTSAYIMERLYDLNHDDDTILSLIKEANLNIGMGQLEQFKRTRKSAVEVLNTQQPGIIEALQILSRYRGSFADDVRHDNIMKRKDGTVVIIDPYGPTIKNGMR